MNLPSRLPWIAIFAITLAGAAAAARPDCRGAHQLFMQTCSMCHGANGAGYPTIHTPNFTDPKWQARHTDAELIAAVTHGKQGAGRMPAFQGQLTPKQIDALVRCVVRGYGKSHK